MRYKVGDRVKDITVRDISFGEGTVIFRDNSWYGVKFDNYHPTLHSLEGYCNDYYGYWCKESELEFVSSGDNVLILMI